MSGPVAGVGSPRRRQQEAALAERVRSWLAWSMFLLAFWVVLDYSFSLAELLVGAGVAALSAFVVELVQYQAASEFRIRIKWVGHAFRLPRQVLRDTVTVLVVLWRRVISGQQPASGFVEMHNAWGDESALGTTRRALLVAAASVAPNTLALGIDPERDVLVAHQLVVEQPPKARR
ncbi:MAG TPA: Na+/H+ antiporter subunit E [Pseudonocardiaceae bacterium]|nr:Na+/H+ antiporter subunit E [Pseudonocardiaceae bacterium]